MFTVLAFDCGDRYEELPVFLAHQEVGFWSEGGLLTFQESPYLCIQLWDRGGSLLILHDDGSRDEEQTQCDDRRRHNQTDFHK